MRKITGFILAIVFVLCLSPTVFAADDEKNTDLSFTYSASGPTYTVTADGTWKKGTATGFIVTTDGDSSKLTGVKVNGVLIDPSNYTLSGNTVITLKPEFLETLSVGDHNIEIVFSDGSVQTIFAVLAADIQTDPKDPDKPKDPTTPDTGDHTNVMLWLLLVGSSMVTLGGMLVIGRRKKKNAA